MGMPVRGTNATRSANFLLSTRGLRPDPGEADWVSLPQLATDAAASSDSRSGDVLTASVIRPGVGCGAGQIVLFEFSRNHRPVTPSCFVRSISNGLHPATTRLRKARQPVGCIEPGQLFLRKNMPGGAHV